MKSKFIILASFVLLAFSACSHDSFTPGDEPQNTKGLVWFSGHDQQNTYYFYDQPQADDSVYVFIARADSTEALTIVLEHDADACLTLSDTVRFRKGESETYIPISVSQIRISEPAAFTLRIPKEYANPYAEKSGVSTFSSNVLWSNWTPVSDTMFVISYYEKHAPQGCQLENFQGANVFRITNFMGSGNPLMFSLSNKVDPNNIRKSSGMLRPMQNCYYPPTAVNDKIWDWSNDGLWTPFTPKGSSVEVSYVEFGWGHQYYDSYGGYDNLDLSIKDTSYINFGGERYMYDSLFSVNSVQMVYVYSTTSANSYWDYLDFMICYKAPK